MDIQYPWFHDPISHPLYTHKTVFFGTLTSTYLSLSFLKSHSLSSRRSEFLGCVSFPLKDATKADITGTYFLQSSGRPAHEKARVSDRKMATDNTETSTNDGTKENNDKGNQRHL